MVDAVEAMHAMKREALDMKECLLKGDFDGIVETMRAGWKSKKISARTVSTPHIEEIYNAVMNTGALAGKVSGAGGGGFMMFFVPPDKRMDVIRILNGFEGQVSNCHFTKRGAVGWRIG
jgi:D-glycero-alpha-D-manno-heptose-7-phosphate kinase